MKYKLIITILITILIGVNLHADSLNEGNSEYMKDNYAEALSLYEKAIIKNPNQPIPYANMGNTMFHLQDYNKAISNYQKAIQIINQDRTKDTNLLADIYYNLSTALYYNDDYQEALESSETSLKLNPDNKDAKYNWYIIKKNLAESQGKKPSTSNDNSNQGNDEQDKPQDKQNDQNDKDNQDNGNKPQNQNTDDNSNQNKDNQNQSTTPNERETFLNEMKTQELMNRKNSPYKGDKQELGEVNLHLDKDW